MKNKKDKKIRMELTIEDLDALTGIVWKERNRLRDWMSKIAAEKTSKHYIEFVEHNQALFARLHQLELISKKLNCRWDNIPVKTMKEYKNAVRRSK